MAERGRVRWLQTGDEEGRFVAYHGPIRGRRIRLRYGFDGWREPIREVPMQQVDENLAVVEVHGLEDHVALDCAIALDNEWDNNVGVDYRLWIEFDALDAHLHISGRGAGALGIGSLQTAMASAGVVAGISSWIDNRALDNLDLSKACLFPLVWVRPGEISAREVAERLSRGAVGLKLHPTVDDYRADDPRLDRYLDIAENAGCPVACHSAPGDADPDNIRRLAERHPDVPVILYHSYLGPSEGRGRALRHALEQSNLYLESSWCRWQVVHEMVEAAGPERILFGSDASIDGVRHYRRDPPNVEGIQTYNDGLISLVTSLGPENARKVMGDNARRIFRLNGNSRG